MLEQSCQEQKAQTEIQLIQVWVLALSLEGHMTMNNSLPQTSPENDVPVLSGFRSPSQLLNSMAPISLTWITWVSFHLTSIPYCPLPICCWPGFQSVTYYVSSIGKQLETGMFLPHVPLFILIVYSLCFPERWVGGEKRKEGWDASLQISYKYYCPTPHVGPGPEHGRQSACGKTGPLPTSMLPRSN